MCIAQASIGTIITSTISGVSAINQISNERKNLKYQTQIALNNAKKAQNEAKRQKQLGIEEARIEKINAIKEKNAQEAKNASSGFNLDSNTFEYSLDDILNSADTSAQLTLNNYEYKSQDYINSANSYINQAKNLNEKYNESVFKKGLYYLSEGTKVASSWYNKN